MGSFLACFRARDDRRHHQRDHVSSDAPTSKPREAASSRNRLSFLFLAEENEDYASKDNGALNSGYQLDTKDLKDKANCHKVSGIFGKSPDEYRKLSQKLQGPPHYDNDSEPSKFQSCLLDTSIKKLHSGDQPDQQPTPARQCEDLVKGTGSSEHMPSSCLTSEWSTKKVFIPSTGDSGARSHASQSDVETSVSPGHSDTEIQGRKKSVTFECDVDASHPQGSSKNFLKKSDSPGENLKEVKVEESLTDWLKPVSPAQDMGAFYNRNRPPRKTPVDRPIIGMVAAHWNQDEFSQISAKWWDGNGIPNSTNKYKEDQKVKFHATPFEERLEKALSEESLISQRKIPEARTITFNHQDEESDTAMSQLQSSTHPKSVVTF